MQKYTIEAIKVCAVFYNKSIDIVMQVCYNIITARETNQKLKGVLKMRMINCGGYSITEKEYKEWLIERFKFWVKAFAEDHRPAFACAIENISNSLINEGYDWEFIENLEIETIKSL